MRTKISANSNNKQTAKTKSVVAGENTVKLRSHIRVEIPEPERKDLVAFYSIDGMRAAFVKAFPGTKRDDIDNGLGLGKKLYKIRVSLLDDLRTFYSQHKDEVKDIIPQV